MTVRNNEGNSWLPILLNFSPIFIIAALWFFMLRQMAAGSHSLSASASSRPSASSSLATRHDF